MEFFKKLFKIKTPDYVSLIESGAVIIDVRTPQEFIVGHIVGSENIPLQTLPVKLYKLEKEKPVITVCASGIRSASAKAILKSAGFEAYNGGAWLSLEKKYKKES